MLFLAVLTAAASRVSIPLPFTPVPLTIHHTVMLAGAAVVGARLGLASQLLYLALGLAGLPVFAASPLLPQGAARLLGPTGGYLIAYPLAAFVTGWVAERGHQWRPRMTAPLLAMSCGLAMVLGMGVAWLALSSLSVDYALAAGFFPFVLADALKLVVGAALVARFQRRLQS